MLVLFVWVVVWSCCWFMIGLFMVLVVYLDVLVVSIVVWLWVML